MSGNVIVKRAVLQNQDTVLIQAPRGTHSMSVSSAEMVAGYDYNYQKLLDEARIQADKILAEAEDERKKLFAASKASGFEEGYSHGELQAQQDAKATCDTLIQSAESIVFTANTERQRLLSSTLPILTDVVMTSVKTIIQREMLIERVDVSRTIEDLLKYVIEGTRIEVRVNPDDYDSVLRLRPKIQGEKFGEWDVMVIADPNLDVGGCTIRSDSGYVDSSMDAKLTKLREVVERHLGRIIDDHA
ncbi:hypothetical protein AN477_07045 [Alicyclobacillus ferrooxydans]|uniref:Flagellar assembly protein FliH/Type III secretion system HrpE domain-containing protein n=1 Tax=Alicyclobacillus ferrooxydans TaxID=471514 RepID=A0A0P9CN97_9BACL|nr:hypothetical protein AN477_07045 [Alicyclobacillus ferrooxydans]